MHSLTWFLLILLVTSGGATCILGGALAPPKFLIFFNNLSIFYKYLKVIWKKKELPPKESIDKMI